MKRIVLAFGAVGLLTLFLTFLPLKSADAHLPPEATDPVDPIIYFPSLFGQGTPPQIEQNEPRDGVPVCENHDSTSWHAVYDEERDCHYDHHHGQNPFDSEIVALLGPPDTYTGQGISYPWETPQENELKHRAYFWQWQINETCIVPFGQMCIKAYRLQLHADMGVVGFNARIHSFWAEMLACDRDNPNDCGILRSGGWGDTGYSYSPYFGDCVDVQANPTEPCPDFSNTQPYRVIARLDDKQRILKTNGVAHVIWGYDDTYTDYGQQVKKFVFSTLDSWAAVNPDNALEWEYMCPDFQCRYNGSLTHIAVLVTADQEAGTETGFTNREGTRNSSCTDISPKCVPYIKENWPTSGAAVYHRAFQFPNLSPRDPDTFYEADQSPAQLGTGSEWWLVPTNTEPRP